MVTDQELVDRVRAGDDTAFDVLVDRHADHVYAICLRYFGDPHDAEDAMQAAFLACYRGLATFRGQAALSTWLYRVATNACHDLARRGRRQPRTVQLDDRRHGDHEPFDQATVDRLAAAELQPQLLDALAQLDADQRRAVLLRDVVGASYTEIADAQAVAVGTAKSRVHRAHARLAEILQPTRNQPPRRSTPTVQDTP
ncbi:MAG: sigma-70 family RNA polymerase sigma factor [Actinobacteria bacterium]|nr:sigma-70 family RNA polymerase sigma factor [Actinomycetota bacterium]